MTSCLHHVTNSHYKPSIYPKGALFMTSTCFQPTTTIYTIHHLFLTIHQPLTPTSLNHLFTQNKHPFVPEDDTYPFEKGAFLFILTTPTPILEGFLLFDHCLFYSGFI